MRPFLTQAYKMTSALLAHKCFAAMIERNWIESLKIKVLITMVMGYMQDFRLTG